MKHCENCGTIMEDDVNFCPSCGQKQEKIEQEPVCPSCGKPLNPNACFCGGCGTKIFEADAADERPSAVNEERKTKTASNKNNVYGKALTFTMIGIITVILLFFFVLPWYSLGNISEQSGFGMIIQVSKQLPHLSGENIFLLLYYLLLFIPGLSVYCYVIFLSHRRTLMDFFRACSLMFGVSLVLIVLSMIIPFIASLILTGSGKAAYFNCYIGSILCLILSIAGMALPSIMTLIKSGKLKEGAVDIKGGIESKFKE